MGARVVVLGAAYRGGVKETAFSGVFDTVASLTTRGAEVSVHDPLYTDDELVGYGFTPVSPRRAGSTLRSYRPTTPSIVCSVRLTCPASRAFIDGRRVSSPEVWGEVAYPLSARLTDADRHHEEHASHTPTTSR